MDSLNISFLILALIGVVIGLIAMIYWIRVLIDCATNEASSGNDKIVWLVIIFFSGLMGALLYVLVRKPKRIEELGH